jgi:hypothetical protein
MIHMVMTSDPTKYQITDIEAAIRLFLIKYDTVDKGLTDKDVPSWISRYNFLCLLNLPDTIRHYGHVRNLWEGGSNGEGYLKRVKNVLKPGLINQWQKWSISNLLKDQLYSEWNEEITTDELMVVRQIRKECKVYSNRKHALREIDSGNPFSAIVLKNDKKYVCFRHTQKIKGMKIIVTNQSTLSNGTQYHTIKIAKGHIDIDDAQDVVGLIFLPKMTTTQFESRTISTEYCMVKSDWT